MWETGVSSEVVNLPEGFTHRTILVAYEGITATVEAWGKAVRAVYGTNRSMVERDLNVQYLSYW